MLAMGEMYSILAFYAEEDVDMETLNAAWGVSTVGAI